ncbi:hypothetical protein SAMN02800687_2103 [Curtobacterium sp. UNCCL20]|uniref:hypothetical protein n=1 Tax=Curtobacterium sp. UNCCL20 TaxID=1502773 RepID=UPI000891D98F|nr:hypothetical protein [Curtobacterium sp. UNCCL20]SDQ61439.1 hypothetical protein SAMN02800687_2103 [Curtobacterium sp. UNCCL20]
MLDTPRQFVGVPRRRSTTQSSEAFTHWTMTPEEIEARRLRPRGTVAERADRVRQILDASTFTVAPRQVRRPWRGV